MTALVAKLLCVAFVVLFDGNTTHDNSLQSVIAKKTKNTFTAGRATATYTFTAMPIFIKNLQGRATTYTHFRLVD